MAKTVKTVQSPASTITMDAKDIQILLLLQQNARMSVKEIADQVLLSTTPVHERIKRMETAGIIKQYAALLDHTLVGRSLIAICYVSLKEHSKTAGLHFIKAINAMPEVTECYTISGEFDFMLKAVSYTHLDVYKRQPLCCNSHSRSMNLHLYCCLAKQFHCISALPFLLFLLTYPL